LRFGLFITFSSEIRYILLHNCDPDRYLDELVIQMEKDILVVSPQDALGDIEENIHYEGARGTKDKSSWVGSDDAWKAGQTPPALKGLVDGF